jgi:metal-responsive CopG/Arc/MetJ family transcriptional regulator
VLNLPRRPGRPSQRVANVTVSLPLTILDKLDDLIDKRKIPSRSQAVREALERFLKSFD